MGLNSIIRKLFGLLLAIYMLAPVIFKYSPFIQRNLLFMNHVNTQYSFNLSHPEAIGIQCSRTLRLQNYNDAQLPMPSGELKIELGVWHIVSNTSLQHCTTNTLTNRTSIQDAIAFADSRPIILYIHGNGGTRAGNHRSQLYRKLAYQFDYHIITFDYRGYADSTYLQPTAEGLIADARFMYKWLLNQPNVERSRVTVWGHSLGTAVAVGFIATLPETMKPNKLVLEAPFESVANAIANHPFSIPFRIIPFFEYYFVEPIQKSRELNFDSAAKIGHIKPGAVMILHAQDDGIIPYKLGYDLHQTAVKNLGETQARLITIGADEGLGHKHICRHDDTMTKVNDWITAAEAS